MRMEKSSVILLHPPGDRPPEPVSLLTARASESPEPGSLLVRAWRERSLAGLRTAYAHGERHDLWWEFALIRSLEASAQEWDLAPSLFRWRMHHLTEELTLGPLLHRRVLDLSPSERARANLAAALLRRPDVLLWDDPFVAMGAKDEAAACRVVGSLIEAEGLIVLAASAEPHGLAGLSRLEARTRQVVVEHPHWPSAAHLQAL